MDQRPRRPSTFRSVRFNDARAMRFFRPPLPLQFTLELIRERENNNDIREE